MMQSDRPDTLEVVRSRLRDGRTIADSDVHWLVTRLDALQAIAFGTDRKSKVLWQPIATAPKDGTQILGYDASETYLPDEDDKGYIEEDNGYVHELTRPVMVLWWKKGELRGSWTLVHYDAFSLNPTHWMHLPEAPDVK